MKLRIYDQGGGLIYTPFIPEQYAETTTGSSRSSDDEDSKIDPLDKEILGLMKDQNLLPSDIQMIYDRLIAFQRRSQNLSALSTFGGASSYRSVMPGMLQIMNYLSQAKYNKAADDKAITQMMNENVGNEVALDGYGRMYVWTKEGKISKILPSSFDRKEHIPISNSQLLHLRETDSSLAFDTEIFQDVRNMVGMGSVSKEIERIIKAFGTEEGQRYLSKETAQIFSDLNTPDGAYKLTIKQPSSGLKQAWKTIYDQLPSNMQHLIEARAKLSGDTAETYISDIVLHNMDTTQNIAYDQTMSKAAGFDTDPSKTSEDKLQEHDNYQIRFATGQGLWTSFPLTPTSAKINDQGTYLVQGLDFGPLLNMDELPLEQMNLQTMFFSGTKKSSALATSVRSTDITFGNKLLDYSELPAIMVNGGESLTTKVYLPYKNENGHYVPDFDKIAGFNKYIASLKSNMSTTERNALLQECGLTSSDIIPSEDGRSFVLRDTMPFLAFSGYVGDDTLKFTDDEKRYLSKVDRQKGLKLKDGYNRVLKYNDVYANEKKDSIINKKFEKATANDFWKGLVFIPCPDAFYAYNSTKNQPVTRESLTGISDKVMANNILNQATRDAKLDPNYDDYTTIGQWR